MHVTDDCDDVDEEDDAFINPLFFWFYASRFEETRRKRKERACARD